jgi:uncharacterized protein DUF1801
VKPFASRDVKAVFDAYPEKVRASLLKLRELILTAAAETTGVGPLTEALKWGEPAYLPATPRVGTTVRIHALKGARDKYAAFFHCQTTLIATFRERYSDQFVFEGDRAIVFSAGAKVPEAAFKHCVALALTYHLRSARKSLRSARPRARR